MYEYTRILGCIWFQFIGNAQGIGNNQFGVPINSAIIIEIKSILWLTRRCHWIVLSRHANCNHVICLIKMKLICDIQREANISTTVLTNAFTIDKYLTAVHHPFKLHKDLLTTILIR
ncbi:hypothetical protein D3C71_965080 [compost metagenome]